MTHVVALNGQWEGLRAIPRTLRTQDHRERLEGGLDRLAGLYEQMATRAALLAAGIERLNGLRAGMIDQLDALDAASEDLEPVGDDEPSLCGVRCGILSFDTADLEMSADDDGEPDVDDEPDSDREASLCGITFGAPADPFDYEAPGIYGVDQTREPKIYPCWNAAPRERRPTKPLMTVVGPLLPVFGADGWRMGIVRDGKLVVS